MADPNFELIKEYDIPTKPIEENVDQIKTTLTNIWGVFEKVGNAIFTVGNLVVQNWKLAVIGVVALVVLLKD